MSFRTSTTRTSSMPFTRTETEKTIVEESPELDTPKLKFKDGDGDEADSWADYPRNLKGYVPVVDYHSNQDVFFTYKSLFSNTTCIDVFDVNGGAPEYKPAMSDDALLEMLDLNPPELRVIFIDRIAFHGVAGSGNYTMTIDTMRKCFTHHQVPMDFIQGHAVERDMSWPSETRCLMDEDGVVDTESFEFWYNIKLRTKRLTGKGGDLTTQLAIYHRFHCQKSTIYIINADSIIKDRFRNLRYPWKDFDPFSCHTVVLERILDAYSEESWNVREIVKILTFNQSPEGLLSDPQLSRYMHRKAEVASILEHELDLLLEVVSSISQHHTLHSPIKNSYTTHRISRRLISMSRTTMHLKQWCQKCHIMMQGQLSLAYNSINQADSRANIQIALLAQKDSRQMRIISFVTIMFLPPTAVASIFGSNFFVFDSIAGFTTSPKIWIYFVVTVGITLLIYGVWLVWRRIDQPKPLEEENNGDGPRGLEGTLGLGLGLGDDGDSLRLKEPGGLAGKGLLRSFTAIDLASGRV